MLHANAGMMPPNNQAIKSVKSLQTNVKHKGFTMTNATYNREIDGNTATLRLASDDDRTSPSLQTASAVRRQDSKQERSKMNEEWYKIELTHGGITLKLDFMEDKIRAWDVVDAMKQFHYAQLEKDPTIKQLADSYFRPSKLAAYQESVRMRNLIDADSKKTGRTAITRSNEDVAYWDLYLALDIIARFSTELRYQLWKLLISSDILTTRRDSMNAFIGLRKSVANANGLEDKTPAAYEFTKYIRKQTSEFFNDRLNIGSIKMQDMSTELLNVRKYYYIFLTKWYNTVGMHLPTAEATIPAMEHALMSAKIAAEV